MENKLKEIKIGYIGLGKMGFSMVERMLDSGYNIVANNRSNKSVDLIKEKGAEGVYEISDMINILESDFNKKGDIANVGGRLIWIMVPWQAVDDVLFSLKPHLREGDLIIDGGNSPYLDSVKRHNEMSEIGVNFLDIGVSGGPEGARNGACMMAGGKKEVYKKIEPLLKDLCVEKGFGYMGTGGAGHFVKMVHNGIEYGMMQAIGEGFEIMKKSEFNIDLDAVTNVYNHGSVIESRLIGWLKNAYKEYGQDLQEISGEVSHSGEGLWTVEAAERLGVPVENIKQSLQFRIDSKGNPSYTGKVVSALRNQFGGHDVSK
jgi:6-phosphogluconate dehydrogenase